MEKTYGILRPALVLNHDELDSFLNKYATVKLTGNSKEARLERMSDLLSKMDLNEYPWISSYGSEQFRIHEIKGDKYRNICLVYKNNAYKRFRYQDVYALYADTDNMEHEFKEKIEKYVPKDFEWNSHIGTLIAF